MFLGIEVEHHVPHVYTQNGLAKMFIKRLQLTARTLVMRIKLLVSAWGYLILHIAMLVRLRHTTTQPFSVLQLVTGYEPDVSHLRIFGCAVHVPIALPQHTKMSPQHRKRVYVGYEYPSIIRFLEPLTCDLFTARFTDCHFDETDFSILGGDKNIDVPEERHELM